MAFYHVGTGFLGQVQWSPGPLAMTGAPPQFRHDAAPDGTVVNKYQVVAMNILSEDTIPSAELAVPCSASPFNVSLFWIPVPGAVGYKILRNGLRLTISGAAFLGATTAKSSVYTNYMTYKDTNEATNAYTAMGAPCQHLLPFATDGTLPSQG